MYSRLSVIQMAARQPVFGTRSRQRRSMNRQQEVTLAAIREVGPETQITSILKVWTVLARAACCPNCYGVWTLRKFKRIKSLGPSNMFNWFSDLLLILPSKNLPSRNFSQYLVRFLKGVMLEMLGQVTLHSYPHRGRHFLGTLNGTFDSKVSPGRQ